MTFFRTYSASNHKSPVARAANAKNLSNGIRKREKCITAIIAIEGKNKQKKVTLWISLTNQSFATSDNLELAYSLI